MVGTYVRKHAVAKASMGETQGDSICAWKENDCETKAVPKAPKRRSDAAAVVHQLFTPLFPNTTGA